MIPASFLTSPPAVEMAPTTTMAPVESPPTPLKVMFDARDRNAPERVRLPVVDALVMSSVSLNWSPEEMVSRAFDPDAFEIAVFPLATSSIRYPPVPAASVKGLVVVVSPMLSEPRVMT